MADHRWIEGDRILIKLEAKAYLLLTREEFIRALKRGKGYLRARQRQKILERAKYDTVDKGFIKIR